MKTEPVKPAAFSMKKRQKMLYRSLVGSALLAGLVLSPVPTPVQAADMLALADVRAGSTGVGRTVFEGSKVEEFNVTILGVLENVGPRQSMILARLEGGPLARTGVMAGMSGSPVFVDGKLLGAVAYAFPFAKEAIAGITPIGEMIEATREEEIPRAAATRALPFRPTGLPRPLDRASLVASLLRPLQSIASSGAAASTGPRAMSGSPLAALPMPLVFSGLTPETFEWARGVFSGLGFTPVQAAAGTSMNTPPVPAFEPGAAIGITLIEGDMDVSATGTITHIDGDRVYAFGHPFFNLGPTQFPMRKAYVHTVFPNLYVSSKIATPVEAPVGTMEQDRLTAISGRLGKPPRMIPMSVTVETSRGQEREYSFRMVEDELFSPLLAYTALLSVLQANERAFGTSTIHFEAEVALQDGRTIELEDIFANEQPAAEASGLLAAPLAYLMSNGFESITVDKLDVTISSYETNESAALERAWIERTGPVRAGSSVDVKLLLRTYRGDTVEESVTLAIPPNARPGAYSLVVADAPTLTVMEQREMRTSFQPKDLDQLIRAINGLRRNNHLYVRLMRPEEGAVVAGEFLQSLPPSILSVLGTAQGDDVVPTRTASVWEHDLHTDYAVSGSRTLTLTVER
jgi:hypothetical protein